MRRGRRRSGDGVETQNTLRCALEERWTAPAGRPATPMRARKKTRGIHTGTPTEQNAPNGSRAHAAVLEEPGEEGSDADGAVGNDPQADAVVSSSGRFQ